MQLACFENLVGIRTSCGEQVASDSGLYLQDLPLINLKTADAVLTDEDSAYMLLKKKLEVAGDFMLNDINNRLAPYFKYHSVIENQIAGYYQENKNVVAGTADTMKGIQLWAREWPNLEFFLSSVSLFVDFDGTVDLKVIDLVQGKVLDTIPITCVAGEINTVDIYKSYQTSGQRLNLFIGYDSESVSSYQTYVFNSGYLGCQSCPGPRSYGNKYVALYSKKLPNSALKVQNSLQSSNDTGGLSVTYSLNCSANKFICAIRSRLAMALQYQAAVQLLMEIPISNRFNSLVTLKKEEAAELQVYYEDQYKKSMDNVLKNVRLPNDICFKCNKRVSVGVVQT